MKKDNIIRKLKTHGVTDDDMITFTLKLRDKSFNLKDCDAVLTKLGYAKLFSPKKEEMPISHEEYDNKLINDFLEKRTYTHNEIDSQNDLYEHNTFELV